MITALPDWPAMMDLELARHYCGGLGEKPFRALAAANGVTEVDLGPLRGLLFKRADLDRMIDNLPTRQDGDATDDRATTRDPAAAALQKVRQRASGRRP
ncbi:hypothetical protein [Caulobacter rhizosphaerae]|uniref:hypothetical protein n=1 Tax=Caulobacter rhizosphaerae TaxID=2010972 RepID=UPI0013D701A7|nr:hypothetical protein [Caulobacter rhizosphaerae]GGL48087.1 hypothetical protein GCM10010983_51820 [Caulobacter rhizosphaerae]